MSETPFQSAEWMSLEEAAAYCNISTFTVRRAIKKGLYPHARRKTPDRNSAWLIPIEDLNQALSASSWKEAAG